MRGPLVYALEKGIILVLNNFQQASNELIVAIRNIVDNGFLHVRNLDKKVYAKLGFKVLCVTNHPIPGWNLPLVVEQRKDAKELIPKDIPPLTKQYLEKLFDDNSKIGYRKL